MFDSLLIMQATDYKSKYTCMEVGLQVVGYLLLVVGVLEVVELLQLLVVVQIFGEVEMMYQLLER